MKINGIDLGGQGAICSLSVSDSGIVEGFEFHDLSSVWNPYNKTGKELNTAYSEIKRLSQVIGQLEGKSFIEDVKPFKGMSSNTVHTFSGNIASIYMLFGFHEKEFISIGAATWQSLLKLQTKNSDKEKHKEEIKNKLLEIYPSAEQYLYTKRGKFLDGRSDALGIAHAGLQTIKEFT